MGMGPLLVSSYDCVLSVFICLLLFSLLSSPLLSSNLHFLFQSLCLLLSSLVHFLFQSLLYFSFSPLFLSLSLLTSHLSPLCWVHAYFFSYYLLIYLLIYSIICFIHEICWVWFTLLSQSWIAPQWICLPLTLLCLRDCQTNRKSMDFWILGYYFVIFCFLSLVVITCVWC